ncbi:MAG: mechanosensitive ion channel family protein [Cyclobacteriaceae bacterium]|nr:mechanosensitive ion channel family protein [Cyclobacteriaceae bacterium]
MIDELTRSFEEFWLSVVHRAPNIIVGTIFLIIFIFIGVVLKKISKRSLARHTEDMLLINFVGRVIYMLMLIVGLVIFLNQAGLGKIAGGLLAGAGVSAIIIGFAFKDIGENFLAGFFLAFSRPFGIGDVIEVQGIKGTVKSLEFRNTHIRTFDGQDVFVPNGMLIKFPLSNYTRDGLLRYDFVVGLDYGDDITQAGQLIMKTLQEETRIEHGGDLDPFLLLDEFSTSTVNIRIFFWVNSKNFTSNIAFLRTEVMNNIVNHLIASGFSLPADIIELKIYQEGQPIPISLKPGKPKQH